MFSKVLLTDKFEIKFETGKRHFGGICPELVF